MKSKRRRDERFTLRAWDVAHGELMFLSNEETGFLVRLVAAMQFNDLELPGSRGFEWSRLARVTGDYSGRRAQRLWCAVAHLFQVNADGHLESKGEWLIPEPRSSTTITPLVAKLIERWGHRCAYCGDERAALEVEHITPRSRGGSDELCNLTLACNSCNCRKSNKTAAEFGFPEVEEMARSFTDA